MACQIRMRTVCRTGMGTASQCVLLCQFMCKACATELDLAERGGWQRQRDRQVVEGAAHVELQQVSRPRGCAAVQVTGKPNNSLSMASAGAHMHSGALSYILCAGVAGWCQHLVFTWSFIRFINRGLSAVAGS